MRETQTKVKNQDYQISDGHVICKDFKTNEIGYSELIINDKESSFIDKRYYNKERRIKDVESCIKLDNYFVHLASILNFIVETSNSQDTNLGIALKKIEKDLLYLQENYTIEKREYKDKYPPLNIF